MIAFASVDLPEPFGPISACTSPFETSRSRPLRISLSSALTCRLRISRSAIGLQFLRLKLSVGDAAQATGAATGSVAGAGPANSTRSASVVPASALVTPPWTRVQSSFVAQALSAVDLVRAQHPALAVGVKALHRRDRALERLDHVEHRDLARRGCASR